MLWALYLHKKNVDFDALTVKMKGSFFGQKKRKCAREGVFVLPFLNTRRIMWDMKASQRALGISLRFPAGVYSCKAMCVEKDMISYLPYFKDYEIEHLFY